MSATHLGPDWRNSPDRPHWSDLKPRITTSPTKNGGMRYESAHPFCRSVLGRQDNGYYAIFNEISNPMADAEISEHATYGEAEAWILACFKERGIE